MRIDLNVDVGEGFGFDPDLLRLATSANVCCGAHAGSREVSRRTAELCRSYGTPFGAHPGIPDRETMGRGTWPSGTDLRAEITDQVRFLTDLGAQYLKPHGTFYNQSATSSEVADVLLHVLLQCSLPLVGLKSTLHEEVARQGNVRFVTEGFVDRRTNSDGLLLDRSLPGAVVKTTQEALDNASSLAPKCETLCVHGDTAMCVELLAAVKSRLVSDGFEVRPWI